MEDCRRRVWKKQAKALENCRESRGAMEKLEQAISCDGKDRRAALLSDDVQSPPGGDEVGASPGGGSTSDPEGGSNGGNTSPEGDGDGGNEGGFSSARNPTQCLPYRQNIEGCQRDLNVTVQNPNSSTGIQKLVPTCCKIIVEMKDVCLLLYFPGNAPAAFLLKRVCIIILRNAQPGAPSPSPSRLY
ncbi:hypothetical protein K2173_021031 [Erythroxylum novogranatense]|uniref:Prolamin-like domain-containing protein n=1 Tax=Erythroxylum novogranatense TaxID=1862640 RepID=A0AAV8TNP8_9ROSI|nr:hypothetical protein K2173_021031 [Erythroxylum novogranatense]